MNKHSIEISDHAIARYIERGMKISNEEVLHILFTDRMLALIEAMGAGRYRTKDGHKAVVEANASKTVIVTII